MKNLTLTLFFLLSILANTKAQFGPCYDAPTFEFTGTVAAWSHRIIDPYKDTMCAAIIKYSDQTTIRIDPKFHKNDFIAVYDNMLFGTIIESYNQKTGQVNWRQSFNRKTTDTEKGTSCIDIQINEDNTALLTCFQSTSVGVNILSTTVFAGFINQRTISLIDGSLLKYVLNPLFADRIVRNVSKPLQKVRGQNLYSYFFCNQQSIDSTYSYKCDMKYIDRDSLRKVLPTVVPPSINFKHKDSDGFGPNYATSGPLIENDSNFIYFTEYYWEDKWRHEMWKVDDYGNLKWRKDFTSLMATPQDSRGSVYPDFDILHDRLRLYAKHRLPGFYDGHGGYIDFDFNGDVIKDNRAMIIDNRYVGHLKTINLRDSDDLLHCIRFTDNNNIHFYRQKPDGTYLKAGEMINNNRDIYAFIPYKINQSTNGDIFLHFNVVLDSLTTIGNFNEGGWQFVCMVRASDLGIAVGADDDIVSKPVITIYPNPTTDAFAIDIDKSQYPLTIALKDMLGNEILNTIISEGEKISLSNLPNGVYNLLLKSKNNQTFSTSHKIIKIE